MTNEKRTPNDPKRIKIAFDSRQNDSTGPAADPAIHFHAAALLVDLKRVPIDPRGMVVGPGIAPKTLESEVSGGHQAAVIPTSEGHALLAQSAEVPIMVNGDPLVQGERRPLAPGDTFAVGTLIAHYVASGEQQLKLPPIERETPRRLLASQNTTTIGRDPACDIVLDHPTVALQHARIVRHQNSANVEDTSGGFGIAVNGRRTNRARLAVGDTISIGPFRVVFDGLLLHQRASSGGLPVAARDVSVQIGRTVILQPTSVSLHPGELVAVIGESGAGKSTLLKALAGVSAPSGGEVLIGGEPVEQRLPEIGYVPQFDIVHGALTVGEALDFAAQLRLPADTSPSERQRLIATTAEELGLRDRLGLKVSQLSGGQRKRVAVGTELLHRPGALFLDEPTTGLDPALERRLMTLFRQLADSGQTVALATHATASLRMCDRVIVMGRGGHLLFNGSPDDLLNAFSVDNFDDLYMEFDRFSHGAADPYLGEGAAPMGVAEQRLAGARPRRVIRHSWLRQTSILSHRYALLVTRDPRFLRSAFLQVPFLGLMTALLFGSDVFERKPLGIPLPTHPDETALLCFVMVTIVTWLGLLNSAREIVKEQELARREFSIGVKVHAYISSKLVVLFSLSTAQSILLVIIVFVVRPPHEGLGRIFGVAVLLAVGSWLGVLLGLITSAFSKTEDQAVGLVPLLLVPQMLFAGAIIQLSKMPDVLKPIAEITPTRWSFAEVGNAMEMTQRLADQPTHLTTTYGSFFELTPVAFFGAWVLCSGAMLIALFVRLSLPPSRAK